MILWNLLALSIPEVIILLQRLPSRLSDSFRTCLERSNVTLIFFPEDSLKQEDVFSFGVVYTVISPRMPNGMFFISSFLPLSGHTVVCLPQLQMGKGLPLSLSIFLRLEAWMNLKPNLTRDSLFSK